MYSFLPQFSAEGIGEKAPHDCLVSPPDPDIPFTISNGSLQGLSTSPGDQPLINNYTETQVNKTNKKCPNMSHFQYNLIYFRSHQILFL